MECACFDSAGDCGELGSMDDFYTTVTMKARKEHKCAECNRIISKGEKYEYTSGKSDGEMYSFKTCADCLSIADAFFCSRIIGSLFVDLEEYLRDYSPEDDCYAKAILTLTDKAREKVQVIFERITKEDEH